MCKTYIHEQAVKVFKTIIDITEELTASKRMPDAMFKQSVHYLIRKAFVPDMHNSYYIYLVPPEQTQHCIRAWEISAQFTKPGEDLFYYIKSAMLQKTKTYWFVFPLQIRGPIPCTYNQSDFVDDLTFLDDDSLLSCKKLIEYGTADKKA